MRSYTDPSAADETGPLLDSIGRYASKLRVSVTDRCNFRCDFCMPQQPVWIPRDEVLSFEEITRVATVLAQMGVTKIRVSGGEPLMRQDVEDLVGMLTGVPGIRAVSMTTNGALLKEKAAALRDKGLSIDNVEPPQPEARALSRAHGHTRHVLAGDGGHQRRPRVWASLR